MLIVKNDPGSIGAEQLFKRIKNGHKAEGLEKIAYEIYLNANHISNQWICWSSYIGIAKRSPNDFLAEAFDPCFEAYRKIISNAPVVDITRALIEAAVVVDRWDRKFKRLLGGWRGVRTKKYKRMEKWLQILEIAKEHPGIGTEALGRLVEKKLKIPKDTFKKIKKDLEGNENSMPYRTQADWNRHIKDFIDEK